MPCESLSPNQDIRALSAKEGMSDRKSASRSRKRSLQGGGSFFGVDLSPSNLEGAIAAQLCHAPSWRKVFRRGLVVLQVGAANFVSDLQVCTPNNLHCRTEMQIPRRTMAFSRPKKSVVLLLERSEGSAVGMPVIFALPMTCENHRLKNRSAYGSKRGIPYLWPYQIERFL